MNRHGGSDGADGSAERSALARAKVNLTLHVLGRRPDGLHLLESLVVFPEIGDRLDVEPAHALGLTLDGAFGRDLGAGRDNLVLAAAAALAEHAARRGVRVPGASLRLVKRLPIASGVGGGSSDAAIALRLVARLWGFAPEPAALDALAAALGADVPVCLRQPTPSLVGGVGELAAPAPPLPAFWLLLVNPGFALPTAEVFGARPAPGGPGPQPPASGFRDAAELGAWLATARNDLAPVAEALRPPIAAVRAALAQSPGCRFARMSGSGATCFGVFDDAAAALAAEAWLRAAEPAWWIAAGPVAAHPGGAAVGHGRARG